MARRLYLKGPDGRYDLDPTEADTLFSASERHIEPTESMLINPTPGWVTLVDGRDVGAVLGDGGLAIVVHD
jgi:hypothetical protein